jgi:hypothetical protein
MATRRAVLLFIAVACSACTTTSPTPSLMASEADPAGHTPTEPATFDRRCGSDVYGNIGRNWRAGATVVGPLALLYLSAYADATPRTFSARGDRYRALKVLAVVAPGRSVTVTVPNALRARLGLLYDPSAFKMTGRYRVEAGEPAVRFHPCERNRATQFNGGLIAAGPGCYALDVRVGGGAPRRLRFPVGQPC